MFIYHYSAPDGLYLGSSLADPDPLELHQAREAVFAPLAAVASAALDAALEAAEQSPDEETMALARAAAQQTYENALTAARMAADAVQPEIWLIPALATTIEPPAFGFDEEAVFDGETWSVRAVPEPEEDEQPEEDLGAMVRADRTRRINQVRWLIDRHRDEQALGLTTTLTAEDYQLVLEYVQALRDVPEQAGFPEAVAWPELPPELLATGA